MKRTLCALCVVSALAPACASAAEYYVSAAGSDSNPGTLASPWQTLARANRATFRPGDRLLLRGGDTFTEPLPLDDADAGTAV